MPYLPIVALFCLVALYSLLKHYIGRYALSTWNIDPQRTSPAHRQNNRCFFPVSRWMLFGSHLQGVITVGTIFLPAICVTFGWVPAVLLFFFGTAFSGWVHDYVSTVLSVRSDGRTLSSVFERFLGKREGSAFWLLNVFCTVILASLSALQCIIILEMYPAGFISTLSVLVSGLVFLALFYRRRLGLPVVLVVCLGIILLGIELGLALPIKGLNRITISSLLYVAAILYVVIPSRHLSQSVGFVASIPAIIVIFCVLIISIYYSAVSPLPVSAFVTPSSYSWSLLDSFWSAFLFSSACGILSGWHSLVGSFATSRHVDLETDIRVVSAGSTFLESALALGSLLVYASIGVGALQSMGGTPWEVFLNGFTRQVEGTIGGVLPGRLLRSLGVTFLAVSCINSLRLAISFWGSDPNCVGSFRLLSSFWGSDRRASDQNDGLSWLDKYIFLVSCIALSWFFTHSSSLTNLWSLFAALSQLLAGLVLMLATLYLKTEGKRSLQTFVPSVFFTLNSLAFTIYLGVWVFLRTFDLDVLLGSSFFSKSFSGGVNLLFLGTMSLSSTVVGMWLIYKSFSFLRRNEKSE